MTEAVKNNIDGIIEICNQMKVHSLFLFGSGARNNVFNENSDLDFVYRFSQAGGDTRL